MIGNTSACAPIVTINIAHAGLGRAGAGIQFTCAGARSVLRRTLVRREGRHREAELAASLWGPSACARYCSTCGRYN